MPKLDNRGRRRTAAGFVLSVVLGSALLGGCREDDSAPGPNEGGTLPSAHSQAGSSSPQEPLSGWDQPRAVLLLSGEQRGYLEPCGCTEKQSGGLARRADLLRMMQEKGWQVSGLDLGGTISEKQRQNRGLQTWYKFQTLLAALKELNYAAIALGPEELKIPVDSYIVEMPGMFKGEESPAFVSANAAFAGFEDFGPARTSLVRVGDVTVGVTSIIGPEVQQRHFGEGGASDVEFKPVEEAIRAALKSLQEQNPDLLVLLSHADVAQSESLAKAFPEFGVVVTAGGPEDPAREPEWVADTMFLKVGRKGKNVGVLGIFEGEGKDRLKFELIELDNERFQNAESMRAHMRSYQALLEENQERVFGDMTDASHPRTLETGATYVGAAKCGECHTKAFEHWKQTKHAGAWQSLIDGREGETDPISRIHDPECLACHVTGWDPVNMVRYEGGFLTEDLAKLKGEPALFEILKDQQCENCHGPGSQHVAFEEAGDESEQAREARRAMWLGKEEALESFCARCHDADNDPHFEAHKEEYWEEVKHPWRD